MTHHRRTERRFPRAAGGILCGALVVLAAWFLLFRVNRFTLRVELEGEPEQILEYGDHYRERGASAVLSGTHFWKAGVSPSLAAPKIAGAVDEGTLGKYTLTYRSDFLFFHDEAVRTVQVVDTQSPVIVLTKETGSRKTGEPYREPGYTAYDNHDGNITNRVRLLKEPGQITYSVIDSSGNPFHVVRVVPNYDPYPPEILLEGGLEMNLRVGTPYREPGFTASDATDGDLTDQVKAEGSVDCFTPGTYSLTYTVTDSNFNETVVTRTVRVTAAERPEPVWPGDTTIYLTFDDGPGPETPRLLDILDKYGAKATFFVTDSGYDEVMRDIAARGHTLGIHTLTHDYAAIYASPEAYFEDLYGMQRRIRELTGVETTLLRFPGGSSNTVSARTCEGIMTLLTEAVQDAGFQYFDWNVDSGDAGGVTDSERIFGNVTQGVRSVGTAIVLQHDIHGYSVDAVEEILRWGRDNGYTFAALDPRSPGFHHETSN